MTIYTKGAGRRVSGAWWCSIVARCHCFSSLKVKKVYVVRLVKKSGDVILVLCTCVAGKGKACSHIVARMLYLEDFMRQGHSNLPTDTTATDHLQQWHVGKCDVSAQPVGGTTFRKAEYGKVVRTSLVIATAIPLRRQIQSWPCSDTGANECCMCCFAKQWTDPLLGHCRAIFSCHANDSKWHTKWHCRCAISNCL